MLGKLRVTFAVQLSFYLVSMLFIICYTYSVEEILIPARRIVIPDPHFSMVDETFDRNQKILIWKWGEMKERYLKV